ncbi:MAG: c-type cytochrome biogenesis protein CcsB [Deltaproteobacteria bacterium]|nr:c-type cytochrome biogenesis protein CcsB [Deltaproteobacteria bacterium]
MSHTSILSWVTFVYFVSFLFYLLSMLRSEAFWGRIATGTALAGYVAHTLALIIRWIASYRLGIGHVPLANFYESLIFFAWAVVLLYLLIEWRTRNRSPGAFVVPCAFLAMAMASLSPGVDSRIQPLIPALQSNWLTSHVVTCFLAYAAFTVAFALGIMFFLKRGEVSKQNGLKRFRELIPHPEVLDELIYQCAVMGFILLTLGIVTGSVWAHYAWGSYWSWDPKETWSLITWLIYAALLHARLVRRWRGGPLALMAVCGFAAVLFTYFGVNLLPGLHTYLQT